MNSNRFIVRNLSGKSSVFRSGRYRTYQATVFVLLLIPTFLSNAGNYGNDGKYAHSDFLTTLSFVGQGEFTWFGFSIYEASLWTRNGRFINLDESIPVALTITYRRHFDGDDLTERTIEEWERLGIYSEQERVTWRKKLKQIWPDVKPGDNITTLVTLKRETRFYLNDKLIAVLDDPTFGSSLLSIWLDPNTSEPDLRERLLGKREE